jgi:hypothetical protein
VWSVARQLLSELLGVGPWQLDTPLLETVVAALGPAARAAAAANAAPPASDSIAPPAPPPPVGDMLRHAHTVLTRALVSIPPN